MDARNLLSIGGVLLVLGGVGYYWGLEPAQLSTQSDTAVRRPDYEVRGIRVTESGKDGHLLRRLDSPGLRHYVTPQDEGVLESPDMRLYDQGREAWHLRAAQAVSLANGNEIRLEGGVIAERSDPAALPVRFTTPSLTAWPEEERLHSNTGIQLQSSEGAISGQSLRVGLKAGTIEINQNVTGMYAPAPR